MAAQGVDWSLDPQYPGEKLAVLCIALIPPLGTKTGEPYAFLASRSKVVAKVTLH